MGLVKRVLITGSNGLLGQKMLHLIRETVPEIELFACSRGENRVTKITGFQYQSVNLSSKEEVDSIIDWAKPDAIIHTAAMTNVDACEQNKDECWASNVKAVEYLLNAASKYNSHFLHLSTDFVFDGEDGPYKEEDQPNPLSYYGNSKWEAEKLVQKYVGPWSIARTIIIYGIVEDMSRSNLILWAKSALEKGERLNIVNDQFRAPVLAEDLAKGCWSIIKNKANGIYHLAGHNTQSIVDIVRRVAKFYGLDQSNIHETSSASLNQAAKRPPRTGFVLDKAKKDLNYSPLSLEEGMAILDAQLKS